MEATCDALRAERDEADESLDTHIARADRAESEAEALRAEVERLRAELEHLGGPCSHYDQLAAANALLERVYGWQGPHGLTITLMNDIGAHLSGQKI